VRTFVACAHRDVDADTLSAGKGSFRRTILFNRDGVLKLFGPTLIKRRIFYRHMSQHLDDLRAKAAVALAASPSSVLPSATTAADAEARARSRAASQTGAVVLRSGGVGNKRSSAPVQEEPRSSKRARRAGAVQSDESPLAP